MTKLTTLKGMAEGAYIMGLETIGEMAGHMRSHYDFYWLISNLEEEEKKLQTLIEDHEEDHIDLYLTPEDKARMDAELSQTLGC